VSLFEVVGQELAHQSPYHNGASNAVEKCRSDGEVDPQMLRMTGCA